MYPHGCKSSKVMAQLLVRKVNQDPDVKSPTLGEKYYSDWIGTGHCFLQNLPAGIYEIFMQYAWPKNASATPNSLEQDYTVRVYAEE